MMQFRVDLRLQGKPRLVEGTARNGNDYRFWTVDGQAERFIAGSLGAAVAAGSVEDPGTLVRGVDVGELEYFGCVWFPPEGGEVSKDSGKIEKVLRDLNNGDRVKAIVRLGYRFINSASGSRVRQNNFTLVKIELVERAPVEQFDEVPF